LIIPQIYDKLAYSLTAINLTPK